MSITPAIRRFILERDRQCQTCNRMPPDVVLHVDHIIPKSKGGSDDVHNLRALCAPCNMAKRDKPPADHEVRGEQVRSLAGMFCHKTEHTYEREGHESWMYELQGRILFVVKDVAMIELYSAWDGMSYCAKPFPLADILGGEWIFYTDHADWVNASNDASLRLDQWWKLSKRTERLQVMRDTGAETIPLKLEPLFKKETA